MPFEVILLLIVLPMALAIPLITILVSEDEPLMNGCRFLECIIIGSVAICSMSSLWLFSAIECTPEELYSIECPTQYVISNPDASYSTRAYITYYDKNKDKIIVVDFFKEPQLLGADRVKITFIKQSYLGIDFEEGLKKYKPRMEKTQDKRLGSK